MSNELEHNSFTGTFQKKHDNTETNSLTGLPIAQSNESDDVRKSDEAKWPSISDIDKRNGDNEDPEPVSKSSDEQPWPSLLKHLVDGNASVSKDSGEFEMNVPIFAVEKAGDEHIVYGIVYEPDTVDSQGDEASEEEIRKAAYHFMENVQTFKVMHKGKPVNTKVLESFLAPQDFIIAKRTIKKGSWVLVTRVNNKKLWEDIKSGKYTGYSMAGTAKVE